MENKNTTKTEQMYCVKCRSKVIITGPDVTKWPNGKKAVHGNCPHCNTKTYKVVRHDWSQEVDYGIQNKPRRCISQKAFEMDVFTTFWIEN